MRLLLRITIIFNLFCFSVARLYSAEGEEVFADSMKDVYTVVGLGIGGAILGLSTLSFAEEPKEKLKNVVIGGAIGIICGVGFVAYSHATRSQKIFLNNGQIQKFKFHDNSTPVFSTSERRKWHIESFQYIKDGMHQADPSEKSVPQISFSLSY
jgi:hypothetical protein